MGKQPQPKQITLTIDQIHQMIGAIPAQELPKTIQCVIMVAYQKGIFPCGNASDYIIALERMYAKRGALNFDEDTVVRAEKSPVVAVEGGQVKQRIIEKN